MRRRTNIHNPSSKMTAEGKAIQSEVWGELDAMRISQGRSILSVCDESGIQPTTWYQSANLIHRTLLETVGKAARAMDLKVRLVTEEESQWLDQIREN